MIAYIYIYPARAMKKDAGLESRRGTSSSTPASLLHSTPILEISITGEFGGRRKVNAKPDAYHILILFFPEK